MFFKKIKRKNDSKKEFIQYKDGKVVTVGVEQSKKTQFAHDEDEIPLYQELPKEKPPKEKPIEKLRRFLDPKKIKILVSIIIMIAFILTLVDIYKSFFVEETSSDTNNVIEQPIDKNINETPKNETPTSNSPNNESPAITPEDEVKKETVQEPNQVPSQPTTSPLKQSLDTANFVNNLLIAETLNEMKYINNYLERKANVVGLKNQLEKSYRAKEEIYIALTLNKQSFIDSESIELFTVTEKRVLASLTFTQNVQSYLNQGIGKNVFPDYTKEYVKIDSDIQKEQMDALMNTLDKHNIPYQINEFTKDIEYAL